MNLPFTPEEEKGILDLIAKEINAYMKAVKVAKKHYKVGTLYLTGLESIKRHDKGCECYPMVIFEGLVWKAFNDPKSFIQTPESYKNPPKYSIHERISGILEENYNAYFEIEDSCTIKVVPSPYTVCSDCSIHFPSKLNIRRHHEYICDVVGCDNPAVYFADFKNSSDKVIKINNGKELAISS